MRCVLEMAKKFLGSWTNRERFAPTHPYHPPQRVRESERLGVLRFPWALSFLYSNHHGIGTKVMEWLAAGQNLAAGQ